PPPASRSASPSPGAPSPGSAMPAQARAPAGTASAPLGPPVLPTPHVPEIDVIISWDDPAVAALLRADSGPIADALLRRAYAELRLQKGFDQLVALPHLRDVKHFWYQIATVRRVLRDFRGRALLADEVGLGKTIEAGLVLKEYWMRGLVRRAIVLVPPSLVSQWVGELSGKFDLHSATPDTDGYAADPDAFWSAHPLIVASLALARQPANRERLAQVDFDMVIVDEAHYVKNRSTASWQLVNGLKKRFLLLLSATPVGNDLSELYNLITLLRPGLLSTEARFRREYGHVARLEDPARRERLRALLSEVMIRNTRAHIDLKLPRRLAATMRVEPDPSERDVLEAVNDFIRARYAAAPHTQRLGLMTLQMQAGSSLAALRRGLAHHEREGDAALSGLLNRLGHGSNGSDGAKTRALVDLLGPSSEKAIVFSRYLATIDALERALTTAGVRVAVFHGQLTAAQKDAAIADFEREARVLLASDIGGEGRNLQFCRTIVNFDLPWNPVAIEQRVGRVHRIGQTRDVYVFNLCLAGSVEERILQVLHDKINLFELVAGEMEMILGRLDEDQDFAAVVMDLWTSGTTPDERARAFASLADRLSVAKADYLKTQSLDRALFGEDYEA
ncbi:MAG: SNF2-related protein, partial [Acidobacteriota bacterium]